MSAQVIGDKISEFQDWSEQIDKILTKAGNQVTAMGKYATFFIFIIIWKTFDDILVTF